MDAMTHFMMDLRADTLYIVYIYRVAVLFLLEGIFRQLEEGSGNELSDWQR